MDNAFGGDRGGESGAMASEATDRRSLVVLEAGARGPAPAVDNALLESGEPGWEGMSQRAHEELIRKYKEGTLGKKAEDEHKSENEVVVVAKDVEEYVRDLAEVIDWEDREGMTREDFKEYIKEMVETFSQKNGGEATVEDFKKYIKRMVSLSQESDQNIKADIKEVEGINESLAKERKEAWKFAWSVWLQAFVEQLGDSFKTLAEAEQEIDAAVAQAVLPDMSAGASL